VVKCESFHAGFWSARMKGLTAFNKEGNSVSAKEIHAKFELLPLLTGKLVFREIRLDGVRMVRLDAFKPSELPTGAVQGLQGLEHKQEEHKQEEKKRFAFLKALRIVEISDAAVDWQLADGRTKLQLEGVNLQVSLDAQGGGGGELSVLRGSWMEMVRFKDLRTGVKLLDGVVQLEGLQAACGEGEAKASAQVDLAPPQPFSLRAEATGVDLEKMSDELPALRLSGQARATFEMQGSLAEEASWKGSAKLVVEDGKFKGVSLFQMLGQIFQIQEISNFKVKQGVATLRIGDRKIWVDEFNIDGGDMALSAPGTLDFDRKLALHARLAVPERLLSGRVAQMLSGGFSPPDAAGLRSIAFDVGGTVDKPSTNLMEKAVGEGLGGVVNQLLGVFLKPKKPDKPEAKEAAAEAKEAAAEVPK
jgi:AsmA-like C-terminal region